MTPLTPIPTSRHIHFPHHPKKNSCFMGGSGSQLHFFHYSIQAVVSAFLRILVLLGPRVHCPKIHLNEILIILNSSYLRKNWCKRNTLTFLSASLNAGNLPSMWKLPFLGCNWQVWIFFFIESSRDLSISMWTLFSITMIPVFHYPWRKNKKKKYGMKAELVLLKSIY